VLQLLICFYASVADPDPGYGAFLPPGTRIRNEFFVDPGSGHFFVKFSYIIFRILVMLSLRKWVLLKLNPETISSKIKVCLEWLPTFFTKDLGSEIWDPE
jgi:hypothetical protein